MRVKIVHRVMLFALHLACEQLNVVMYGNIACQAAAEGPDKCRKLPLGFKNMNKYTFSIKECR